MRTSTAAAAAAILVALAGCSAPTAGAPAPTVAALASSPAAAPTSSPYRSQRIRLLNHCLIKYAVVDGVAWKALGPRQAPAPLPKPDGTISVSNYTEGVWTQTGPATAEFLIDDPTEAPDPAPVDFVPSPAAEGTGAPCV